MYIKVIRNIFIDQTFYPGDIVIPKNGDSFDYTASNRVTGTGFEVSGFFLNIFHRGVVVLDMGDYTLYSDSKYFKKVN